ncbi:hypothetical protein CCHR01_05005 [Colletotrichum chrysophilum]|uniref:Uncharacterized protein n=1 Tax=Colletotrichum chrysophilum TaxID=1836956 RepID=A0AAD9ATE6_9PEZI|nr:hypothetical protein CCHR01_05005 [Colletotrichum chrysophilum]
MLGPAAGSDPFHSSRWLLKESIRGATPPSPEVPIFFSAERRGEERRRSEALGRRFNASVDRDDAAHYPATLERCDWTERFRGAMSTKENQAPSSPRPAHVSLLPTRHALNLTRNISTGIEPEDGKEKSKFVGEIKRRRSRAGTEGGRDNLRC